MSRRNPCLHAVVAVLTEAGISHRVERGGKHVRVCFDVRGRSAVTIVPGTPSDRRAALNARAQVRRQVRQMEVVR